MLSPSEEEYILKNAQISEHIPALMAGISEADLFLADSFLCLAKDDWLIVSSYRVVENLHFTIWQRLGMQEGEHLLWPKLPDVGSEKI